MNIVMAMSKDRIKTVQGMEDSGSVVLVLGEVEAYPGNTGRNIPWA